MVLQNKRHTVMDLPGLLLMNIWVDSDFSLLDTIEQWNSLTMCPCVYRHGWFKGFPHSSVDKKSAMQETPVWRPMGLPGGSDGKESACNVWDLGWSSGWEDPLEEDMATHSSILAWRMPWTEEPGGLQSVGLQRVRHDWVTKPKD